MAFEYKTIALLICIVPCNNEKKQANTFFSWVALCQLRVGVLHLTILSGCSHPFEGGPLSIVIPLLVQILLSGREADLS